MTLHGTNLSHGVAAPSVTLDGVDLGYGLERRLGRYDVVAGNLDLMSCTVENGGVAYASHIGYHDTDVSVFGMTKKVAVLDFETLAEEWPEITSNLAKAPAISSPTSVCEAGEPDDSDSEKECYLRWVGTDVHLNRFEIDPASIPKRGRIEIVVPKGATALIVLVGRDVVLDGTEIRAPATSVWTLSEPGGRLRISRTSLKGLVYAPRSSVEIDQALVMGRVFAQKISTPECDDDSPCSTIDSQEAPTETCL